MPPVVTPMTMASGGPWRTSHSLTGCNKSKAVGAGHIIGQRDLISPAGRGGSTEEAKSESGASPHADV